MIPAGLPGGGLDFLLAVARGDENALVFGRDPGEVARTASVLAGARQSRVLPLADAAAAMRAGGCRVVAAVVAATPGEALDLVGAFVLDGDATTAEIREAAGLVVDVAVGIDPVEEDGLVAWAVGDGSGPVSPALRRIPTGRALAEAVAEAFG